MKMPAFAWGTRDDSGKPRRLEEYIAEETARKLERVIGASATEPRELTEYDALPSWSALRRTEADKPHHPGEPPCPKSESSERRPAASQPPDESTAILSAQDSTRT